MIQGPHLFWTTRRFYSDRETGLSGMVEIGQPLPTPLGTTSARLTIKEKVQFCPAVPWHSEDPVVGSPKVDHGLQGWSAGDWAKEELKITPPERWLAKNASMHEHWLRNDSSAFHFGTADVSSLGPSYARLVSSLAAEVSAALDRRLRDGADPAEHAAEGTEQVVRLVTPKESKALLARGRRGLRSAYPALATMLREHIEPHVAAALGFRPMPTLRRFRIGRNMNPPGESYRRLATTWHWDSGRTQPDRWLKVLVYLSDVDASRGCMLVLRHNTTRQPIKSAPPAT